MQRLPDRKNPSAPREEEGFESNSVEPAPIPCPFSAPLGSIIAQDQELGRKSLIPSRLWRRSRRHKGRTGGGTRAALLLRTAGAALPMRANRTCPMRTPARAAALVGCSSPPK